MNIYGNSLGQDGQEERILENVQVKHEKKGDSVENEKKKNDVYINAVGG